MTAAERQNGDEIERGVLDAGALPALIDVLHGDGYTVIAPTLQENTIVYDEIADTGGLPAGLGDEQDAGRYRVHDRGDAEFFGFAVGPRSWKRWLFPPRHQLWSARRTEDGFDVREASVAGERLAFLGVRACEIHAMGIQDKVFLEGVHVEELYARRRRDALVIAVNCSTPSGTCFCVSMNTGPKADAGYDLALTEILTSDRHDFLVEAGSERGRALAGLLPLRPADAADLKAAQGVSDRATEQMGRSLDTKGVKDLLQENPEHPRWAEIAERCLSCGNCTNVCPTCFCSTTEEVTTLNGAETQHERVWDTCFSLDFSYLQGTIVRGDTRARYRQWLTHKFANWFDQFDTSGCVGCGRCVTWCPVGIDVTAEIPAFRETVEDVQ